MDEESSVNFITGTLLGVTDIGWITGLLLGCFKKEIVMINKIIECENRLLQDRKMLNDLLRMEYNRYLQAQAVNRPQQEAFVPQQAAFVSQPQPVTPQPF